MAVLVVLLSCQFDFFVSAAGPSQILIYVADQLFLRLAYVRIRACNTRARGAGTSSETFGLSPSCHLHLFSVDFLIKILTEETVHSSHDTIFSLVVFS